MQTLHQVCGYLISLHTSTQHLFLIFNGELSLNIYSQGEILGVSIFKIKQLNTASSSDSSRKLPILAFTMLGGSM